MKHGHSESQGTGAPAHPRFTAHFTDPLYDDPAADLGPFGQDEGADLLAEWSERRDELDDSTTIGSLLDVGDEDPADLDDLLAGSEGPDNVDDAFTVLGAGFTVLRLTGHIAEADRLLLLKAVRHLEGFFGPQDELTRMRSDLEAWAG